MPITNVKSKNITAQNEFPGEATQQRKYINTEISESNKTYIQSVQAVD